MILQLRLIQLKLLALLAFENDIISHTKLDITIDAFFI